MRERNNEPGVGYNVGRREPRGKRTDCACVNISAILYPFVTAFISIFRSGDQKWGKKIFGRESRATKLRCEIGKGDAAKNSMARLSTFGLRDSQIVNEA